MNSVLTNPQGAEPAGSPVSARLPHVEVLFLVRPSDRASREQGRLAYVRCTLDGAPMKPLVVVRNPDLSLGVIIFDPVELLNSDDVSLRGRFRGMHLDDPCLNLEVVAHIRDAVLDRARAEGIQ